MVEIINLWLQSGMPAFIRGVRLFPKTDPNNENSSYNLEGKQGRAFYFTQENNREWVIKKFYPDMQPDRSYLVAIRSLVPKTVSCTAASKRVVLNQDDLKPGNGLYTSPDLAVWLQDAVLMPRIRGKSWKEVSDEIRSGTRSISLAHRLDFARSLAETAYTLEQNGCAHRDLSQQNLFLDIQEYIVYLVDFDSMFHGSLYFHKNTPPGTDGYIAPWVSDKDRKWDARKSWHRKADRFACAILIAELLLADRQSPSYYDGALFSQDMFFNSRHAYLLRTIDLLHNLSEPLGDLFYKTISATSYDECPDLLKWQEAIGSVALKESGSSGEAEESREAEKEGVASQEVEDTEIMATPSQPMTRLHYWLLALILLVALLFGAAYYVQNRPALDRSLFAPAPQTQMGDKNVPAVTIPSTGQKNTGQPVLPRKYLFVINYADSDLKFKIDNQYVPLNKDNTALVTMEPGEHVVAISFTGIVFLQDGMVKRTEPVTNVQPVRVDKEEQIVIQINRKEKTWQIK
jgi:serine/threonine protein kinase